MRGNIPTDSDNVSYAAEHVLRALVLRMKVEVGDVAPDVVGTLLSRHLATETAGGTLTITEAGARELERLTEDHWRVAGDYIRGLPR